MRKVVGRLRHKLILPVMIAAAKTMFRLRNRIRGNAPVGVSIAGQRILLHPVGSEAFFFWSRIRIEEAELRFVVDHLAPGDVFCDIGGNAGVFTLLASAKLRSQGGCRIFTFEPTPWTHELLQRNLALNGVQDATVVHAALGKEVGTATLYVNATGSEGLNSLARPIRRDAHVVEEVKVPVMPLDAVLRRHGVDHVDLMKIDVEGAEWDVFLTTSDAMLGRIDQLVVEFHGTDDARFLAAVQRLREHFHVANLHMNDHACMPGQAPFGAWAYEVLFVNKRLTNATDTPRSTPYHPLDRPNTADLPDCQVATP